MNGRLGRVFKILHLTVKNEWPFGYNCKISYFAVENEWPFGCNCKIWYLTVKKRMAAWVPAL